MSYETLKVEQLESGNIIRVTIDRPKALNAMNPAFFKEIGQVFRSINLMPEARVAILRAEGKLFTAGLDLKEAMTMGIFGSQNDDPARAAIKITEGIKQFQQSFVDVFKCRVPVISAIHNLCIGGGVDLACTTDIRYCSKDAQFCIKQIDIGMAADISTLQLFPRLIGNQSTFKELAYTGRFMKAEEALQIGFVSRIFDDKEKLDKACLQTAKVIASKSPVGVYTIKQTLIKAELKSYLEGLDDIAVRNGVMLQSKDIMEAVSAFMAKKKPTFPKL